MLNARGWAAIIVDSHGPRGFLDYEVWRLICAGQLFMGSERAGDVLVSIYDARRMPFVDPERMVLIGASHGGWAIMELLAFEAARRLPFNLAALPAGAPADPLAGVVGTILLYPYCGTGQPGRPRRLAPAGADAVPARRRRHGRALRALHSTSPSAMRRAACRWRPWHLRGRDPRLRPAGAGRLQHARVRRRDHRRGAAPRRAVSRRAALTSEPHAPTAPPAASARARAGAEGQETLLTVPFQNLSPARPRTRRSR